jgi:hypothetical protein
MKTFELATIESLDAVQVFTGGGVDPIIEAIANEVRTFTPDTATAGGRKDIASLAYKVSQSKVLLDKAGKSLVEGWKSQAAKVDEVRKRLRDDLDGLRDEARRPLTEWEEAEKLRIEQERVAAEIAAAHAEALIHNDLFDRQREIERKEAELARIEADRLAKALAERQAQEQKERDARIAKEAADQARREEQEKFERAQREAERKEREAKEAAERAERERIEAANRAEVEKRLAVERAEREAKEAADKKERERLAKEQAECAAEERRQANKRHRAKVQKEVCAFLILCGADEETAKRIIENIDADNGSLKISINY